MTLGEVFERERTNKKLSQKDLCAGICSAATYNRIEKNVIVPDKILIDTLLERLGCNPFMIEFIGTQMEYNIVTLQESIDKAIKKNKVDKALQLLDQYKNKISWKYSNLHLQYISLCKAKICYIKGEKEETNKWAQFALSETKIKSKDNEYTCLSIVEMTALYYLAISSSDGLCILKKLNSFLDKEQTNLEEAFLLEANIKYEIAKILYKTDNYTGALLYLYEAENLLKNQYLIGNQESILLLQKEILNSNFTKEKELQALQLLNKFNDKGRFLKGDIKTWESIIKQK